MQHQAFQCAPQSFLTATPSVVPHTYGYQVQSPRRGKRTRKASGHQSKLPPLSASASSWGVADAHDEEPDGSTSESDEDSSDVAIGEVATTSTITGPARKRRHLGLEDVGRFASMSIDRSDLPSTSLDVTIQAPSSSISTSPAVSLREVHATSVEEPESDDETDIAMQARRGPTIHQLDSNRFYISSLSDDSSDEEADADQAKKDQVDNALQSGPIEAREDGHLVVNGVLIHKLQAIEAHQRQSLHRERASLGGNDRSKQDQGALILWQNPEDLISRFGATTPPSVATKVDTAPDTNAMNTAPVVLEEGDYAYVHRPHYIFSSQEDDDVMDIDD